MKQILIALALILASPVGIALEQSADLREHMLAMGYLLDEIFARSDNPNDYKDAADKTRELRTHLTYAIAKIPITIERLPENQKDQAMIEYHQYLARAIYLTATLEQTLRGGEHAHIESGSVEEDIKNLLHEINVVVGEAHGKFRPGGH
jgi:hypothetical protein